VSIEDFYGGFLDAIGIKTAVIMAAFAGGLTRVALFGNGKAGAFSTTMGVIGGTLTAIYVGPVVPSYLGWPDGGKLSSMTTFFVGVFAMEICKRISVAVSIWTPTINGNGKDRG
jgi:membrane protease YdiL (CAAX protease family)